MTRKPTTRKTTYSIIKLENLRSARAASGRLGACHRLLVVQSDLSMAAARAYLRANPGKGYHIAAA